MNNPSAPSNHDSLELEFKYYVQVCTWATVFNELIDLESGEEETVSEWLATLEGVALTLLFKGDLYKFVTTIFGTTADEVGKTLKNNIRNFDIRRTAETFAKVYQQLEEAGIEPHRVAPKILYPILEGVCLEEDDYLKEKWANLLASSITEGEIHPSYAPILSQLSSLDAKVLQAIHDTEKKWSRYSVHNQIILEALADQLKVKAIVEKTKQHLELPPSEIEKRQDALILIGESIDNLKRLNLVGVGSQRQLGLTKIGDKAPGSIVSVSEDDTTLGLSSFGIRFLKAISSHESYR